MQTSVSSPPTGRVPTRPMPDRNPPMACSASTRIAMFPPNGLRTVDVCVGTPRWL